MLVLLVALLVLVLVVVLVLLLLFRGKRGDKETVGLDIGSKSGDSEREESNPITFR